MPGVSQDDADGEEAALLLARGWQGLEYPKWKKLIPMALLHADGALPMNYP
jgi:hypothetical protein